MISAQLRIHNQQVSIKYLPYYLSDSTYLKTIRTPFNPKTIINYQLTMFNYVSIKVYDVLGNEVAILVNEKQSPGIYQVEFDGSMLTSGVYFYHIVIHSDRVETESFTDTKKMLLIK